MKEYTPTQVKTLIEEEVKHSLEETLREGARHMLQVALARLYPNGKAVIHKIPILDGVETSTHRRLPWDHCRMI